MSKLPLRLGTFVRVFVVVVILALVAYAVSYYVYGSISTTDIVGGSITILLFTYLVHLWLLPPGHSDDDQDAGVKK